MRVGPGRVVLRLFRALDVGPEWVAALTLIALVATVAAGYVLTSVSAPLVETTGFTLGDLEFSGWYPLLSAVPAGQGSLNDRLAAIGFETHPYAKILEAWTTAGVLRAAQRAQRLDFVFAAAYGALALLLAVALWRGQPEYPARVRWVWLVALGTVAALFDELENLRMWSVLHRTAAVDYLLPTAAATVKVVLLAAALVGVIVGVVRAHNARPVESE
jgi:hypothetical protein